MDEQAGTVCVGGRAKLQNMNNPESIKTFWRRFCEIGKISSGEPFQVWFFGNSSEMARELAKLVLQGKKTATASLVATNKLKPESAPINDGFSVVTDFESNPMCVIQTSETRHLPFAEVDAEFAFDEGESDQSLEYWHDVHHKYFMKEAAELNIEFNEKSLIACERFKLLFPK